MGIPIDGLIDEQWASHLWEISGRDGVVEYAIALGGTSVTTNTLGISADEARFIRDSIAYLDSITGLSFVEVLSFGLADLGVYSVSTYAGYDADVVGLATLTTGQMWASWKNFGGSALTTMEAETILHELGHTLGLSHPYGDGPNPDYDVRDTIMSYNDLDPAQNGFSTSDVAALQEIWGADSSTPDPTPTTDDGSGLIQEGSDEDDTLIGGEGEDQLIGLRGADALNAMSGDDLIQAGNGADRIDGGAGADQLFGGFGANIFENARDGAVDQLYLKSDQWAYNYLYDSAGNNTDGSKADEIKGLDVNDRLYIQGVSSRQIRIANVTNINTNNGPLSGLGIFTNGFIEAVYTGTELNAGQLMAITQGVPV